MKKPYIFDEFFASGRSDAISPFLTPTSRSWGKNLSLKSALSATFLLILAFVFSFTNQPLSMVCLCLVYFLSGVPALIASLNDLKNLEINISVLMTTAAFVAVAIDSSLEGALLLVLFELSHTMEHAVSDKARSALHNLNHIAPKFAQIVGKDGSLFEKSIREIQIGEHVLVKQGEIIPLDGKIIDGTSSLNLVHLTGESLPVRKTIGDLVPAGGRNLDGALTIEINRTNADSTLAKIIQLITQAQEAKPKLEQFLDQFGKRYATSIITLTLLLALLLPLLFSMSYFGFEGSIYRALSFLIAASPCALIIAIPTAYLSAISASARKGILLKGGITLDALTTCKMIAFDKTGTLTTGKLECTYTDCPDSALAIAYALERNVVHPIATAICELASKKQIKPASIEDFKSIPGSGVTATFEGQEVSIGAPEFIGLKVTNPGIVSGLKVGQKLYTFLFQDEVRVGIKELIASLPQQVVILTGDSEENAKKIASQLGIMKIFASLRPDDKLDKVSELSENQGLAMVGDGVNDAPALARATVGISMGKIGSRAAIDASDVVLLNDNLHHLSWLFKKANQTKKIVKQNLTLALTVIFFASIPALLGLVPLWLAVILHEGGTVLVGLNSLRLLRN